MSRSFVVLDAGAAVKRRIGSYMRLQRERRGMEQKGVASVCDVDWATVSRWERGVRVPGLLAFLAWCRAVGVEPARALEAIERMVGDAEGE